MTIGLVSPIVGRQLGKRGAAELSRTVSKFLNRLGPPLLSDRTVATFC
jgi:hypothetical protein